MFQILTRRPSFQWLVILLGCAVYACGLNWFIIPMRLYSGGLVGLVQLLSEEGKSFFHLTNLPFQLYGIIYALLNLPLLLLARFQIGQSFLLKSLWGTAGISFFTAMVPVLQSDLLQDTLASLLIGGVITGFGIGLMLTAGGSGGGIEILGVWFSRHSTSCTVGKFSLLFNAALYVVYAFLFQVSTLLYSLLYMIFYMVSLDHFHFQTINVKVLIITKKQGVDTQIMEKTGRGVTKWIGRGAYTGEKEDILLTMVNKYEQAELLELLHELDPSAFLLLEERVQVEGNFQRRL